MLCNVDGLEGWRRRISWLFLTYLPASENQSILLVFIILHCVCCCMLSVFSRSVLANISPASMLVEWRQHWPSEGRQDSKPLPSFFYKNNTKIKEGTRRYLEVTNMGCGKWLQPGDALCVLRVWITIRRSQDFKSVLRIYGFLVYVSMLKCLVL